MNSEGVKFSVLKGGLLVGRTRTTLTPVGPRVGSKSLLEEDESSSGLRGCLALGLVFSGSG